MDKKSIQNRIEALRAELHKHNHRYYILDAPIISDYEFDQLLVALQNLEDAHPEFFDSHSPSQRVGGGVTKHFETQKHVHPMYSLANSYSKQDLLDWEERILKTIDTPVTYVCELKYDGASINITYKNGKLESAVTRGDGTQGDNITQNIKTIRTIPLELQGNDYPDFFEIRGEIILPKKGFEKMNLERKKLGEPLYANPRNTASGSLKLQDSQLVAKRPLECFLYSIVGDDLKLTEQVESLQSAKEWGFKVPDVFLKATSINEVIAFIEHWESERENLDYEIDGVVVKVNNLDQQKELGFTSKAPRLAIAYQYKTTQKATRLLNIE